MTQQIGERADAGSLRALVAHRQRIAIVEPQWHCDPQTLRREFDHRLTAVLEEGVAQSEFTVEDVHLTALAIVGIVGWSQVWFRSGGRLTKEDASERVASLVLAMVCAKDMRRHRTSTPAANGN